MVTAQRVAKGYVSMVDRVKEIKDGRTYMRSVPVVVIVKKA